MFHMAVLPPARRGRRLLIATTIRLTATAETWCDYERHRTCPGAGVSLHRLSVRSSARQTTLIAAEECLLSALQA